MVLLFYGVVVLWCCCLLAFVFVFQVRMSLEKKRCVIWLREGAFVRD